MTTKLTKRVKRVTELHRILNESDEPKLVEPMTLEAAYTHTRGLWGAGKLIQVRRAVYEIVPQEDAAEK